jgi:VanZ family protein
MRSAEAGRQEPRASLAWLAFALWACIVLGLGSDAFSDGSSSRYLLPLLRWLLPEAETLTLLKILHAVRKLAHLVEYAVLGVLCYRALRLSTRIGLAGQLLLTTALLVVLAGADEARQALSSVRSGRLRDVGLDVAGGLAGLAIVVSLSRSRWARRWFPSRTERT